MYLFLFTIIYCVITQVLNIGYIPAMGAYLIGLIFIKGYFSEELKDVYNIEKTKYLYEKIGIKDSLMELLCLSIIFINSYLIDYEPFSLFDFVCMLLLIAVVYRFLFWGITQAIGQKFNSKM
ncbi:hypothetical protein CYL18_15045 [Pradoshia eiseniae]|uniref:Uncharacterized protein n=1 Tax=Pradoshia eiseniae TaxID=2064768 RepID=A0A2S7MX74_9BACI|nr:hypothetical protein [Pradoshia eiseniae]PQD94345.1 hypothetical protein CYL18_15045 [Pradoshia eiseniae]